MSTNDTHYDDVETLLPFYVNGTLEPEARERVDAELKDNPGLHTELQALTKLRETMHGLDFGSSPGRFGLARIMRDIDRQEQPKFSKPVVSWSIAVAAVAALVAVGAAWVVEQRGASYQLASGDSEQAYLKVAFAPDAKQSDISKLLQELELSISGGPTAIGLYHLDPGDRNDLDALAGLLRDRRDLIDSVDVP